MKGRRAGHRVKISCRLKSVGRYAVNFRRSVRFGSLRDFVNAIALLSSINPIQACAIIEPASMAEVIAKVSRSFSC